MNQQQKDILQVQLDNEKKVLNELKEVYEQAVKECREKIAELSSRRDMENLQSIIYQKKYQQVVKEQLESAIGQLHNQEFSTISEYLVRCYEDGYIGVMYDLSGQGIPVIMPIDQAQIVKAIQMDSKLSKPLYKRLGEDVDKLKKNVRIEVSRGIAAGLTWNEIAGNYVRSFKNTPFNKAYNRAMTIARTEGHRITVEAASNAQFIAQKQGAAIVKQWDSTLDGRTRQSHRMVDGEIRELNEKFSNGLMYPGDSAGGAAEVVNCRCALLQRAKWALDDVELNILNKRAKYFDLDKSKDFKDFRNKYLKAQESETKLENITRSSNITDIDKKAIYDYMSTKSYVVNEKLRTGTMLTEEESEFVAILDAALDKMPIYEGNLQRSLLFYSDEDVKKFMNRHTIGNKVTYDEYISTTKGETYNPEGQVQIYIQDAKNGKDISALNDGENEILYKRNSSFLIVNVVMQDGKYFILAVEDNE